MNICKRCGEIFNPEDKFCGFCGFNLAALETSELATQQALKANDIQFNLGLVYYKMGKYTQALEIFEQFLEKDPHNVQVKDLYENAREAVKANNGNS